MVELCSAIAKQTEKPRDFSTQYINISINERAARAMVNTGAEANIMTKTVAERLRVNYVPSNTCLKIVNPPSTPVCGVAQRSKHHIGKWQGKTNFIVYPLDIYLISSSGKVLPTLPRDG